MMKTAASTEINSFELKLFNAIFAKHYMRAARLLKNKMDEEEERKIQKIKPAEVQVQVTERPKAELLKNQPVEDKMFWSRFSKMARRIN